MIFETPILLITFNRPGHVKRVLDAVLSIKPLDLFVFQDGARKGNEDDVKKCFEVRRVVETMIEESEVKLHSFYANKNLGCGKGPVTAINWFFENNEKGIILEDDCLPSKDFFLYCQELLDKYKEDPLVGFIGGSNYGYEIKDGVSYCFGSGHHQTWGWASWRRVWNSFEYDLDSFHDKNDFKKVIKKYYKSLRQQDYWIDIFQKVKEDQMKNSCWDYQFYFAVWRNGMSAICPRVNLVSNVGCGADATHTRGQNNVMLNRSVDSILPLTHPDKIIHNYRIDDYLMRNYIIPYNYGLSGLRRLPYRINKKIKSLVGHKGPWLKKKK